MFEELVQEMLYFFLLKQSNNFRNAIFHKEECPKYMEELTFNMTRANISLIVKQELVKRFSEKNEVFSELYVPFFS